MIARRYRALGAQGAGKVLALSVTRDYQEYGNRQQQDYDGQDANNHSHVSGIVLLSYRNFGLQRIVASVSYNRQSWGHSRGWCFWGEVTVSNVCNTIETRVPECVMFWC